MELPEGQIAEEIKELQGIFTRMEDKKFAEQRQLFHQMLESLKEVEEDEIYDYFLELVYDNEDLPDELAYSRIFKKVRQRYGEEVGLVVRRCDAYNRTFVERLRMAGCI